MSFINSTSIGLTLSQTGLTSTTDLEITASDGNDLNIGGTATTNVNIATETDRSVVLHLGDGTDGTVNSGVSINNGINSLGDTQINNASGQTGTITIGNAVSGSTITNINGSLNITTLNSIVCSDGTNSAEIIPTFTLDYNNSTTTTPIPISSFPKYQVILKSSPMTPFLEGTFNLPQSEVVNCSIDTGTFNYLGCQSGNIYYYDAPVFTWSLVCSTNNSNSNPINCFFYDTMTGFLHVGCTANDISTNFQTQIPINNTFYADTAFNTDSSFKQVGVYTWANATGDGFNSPVNAITGDGGDYIYYGGDFKNPSDGSFTCNKFAGFNKRTGYLEPIDGNDVNGFPGGSIYGMAYLAGYLCVVGAFNSVQTNTGTYSINSCVSMSISGVTVGSVNSLLGLNPLTSISQLGRVKADTTSFVISTNDVINNTINYMIRTDKTLANGYPIGDNSYSTFQDWFVLEPGYVGSVQGSEYYRNGKQYASMQFSSPFLFWNGADLEVQFHNMNSKEIYALIDFNRFSLQAQTINDGGVNYTRGWKITPTGNGFGFTTTLLCDGSTSTYVPTSNYGNGNGY